MVGWSGGVLYLVGPWGRSKPWSTCLACNCRSIEGGAGKGGLRCVHAVLNVVAFVWSWVGKRLSPPPLLSL